MRPHLLRIFAFGAFAQEQLIDFDQLADEGLFLIHGPTGAGKTTLLDAVVFALFGSQGERGKDRFVSQHVEVGTKPEVEFEFSIHDVRYRVTRSPAYDAPKRGGGFTTKAASATLVRLDGSIETPLATKISEVNLQVGDLTGLTSDQFSQLMLLPQGRFEQVLKAKSEDRQALLETLFDTSLYKRATRWIEDKSIEARKATEAANTAIQHDLDNAVTKRESMINAIDGLVLSEQQSELLNADWLSQITDEVRQASEAAATRLSQCRSKLEEANKQRSAAETLADRWNRREKSQRRLEELTGAQGDIDRLKVQLGETDTALGLRSVIDASVEASHKASDAQRGLSKRLEHLATTASSLSALDSAFVTDADMLADIDRVDDGLASQLYEKTSTARVRLQSVAEAKSELLNAKDAAEKCDIQLNSLNSKVDAANEKVSDLSDQQSKIQADLEAARTESAGLDSLNQQAESTRTKLRAAESAAELNASLEVAQRSKSEAADSYQSARDELQDLREQYLDGIAAELASNLQDGSPCPVCGSTAHPEPAEISEHSVQRSEVESAQTRLETLDTDRQSTTRKVQELENQIAGHQAVAGEGATIASLTEQHDNLTAKIELTEAAKIHAENLTSSLAQIEVDIEAAQRELMNTRETSASLTAERTITEERVTELRSKLEELTATGIDPDRLDDATSALAALDKASQDARTATEIADTAAVQAASCHSAAELAVSESQFTDRSKVERLIADYDSSGEHRDSWASQIASHVNELRSVRELLDSHEMTGLPTEEPSVDEAVTAAISAQQKHDFALNRSTLLSSGLDEMKRIGDSYIQGAENWAKLDRESSLLRHVADRVAGKVAPKVSLQRWVLQSYLREICSYANQRLTTMTAGRYRLDVRTTPAGGNAQSGLDLEVHDAFTGQSRDVATLSGGETFQASLALALGVADTVSAHNGGVRLDALFVDEGFGSLDSDSLQLAMDELDRLREGGRMVGLISHVAALRERVNFGVEVIPGNSGSRVRVGELSPV